MSKKLYEPVGEVGYDDLINGAIPAADVYMVTVAGAEKETVLKRGTVLARNGDGKMKVLGTEPAAAESEEDGETTASETLTANCILADDVTVGTEDTEVVAYRTGHFNTNKLIVADGYTLTADDREALRDVGILLSDAVAI